ncbi:hypothetical protein LCGC14_0612950 [marine sediment metagenome]|uniref:Uncharacterized protein n=1 Tax=marine sediment metagenome TaxID=412755 RepID=A0A0F9UFK9_9ZZZZ
MEIIVQCSGCKKTLIQKGIYTPLNGTATSIEVVPCGNIACNNCTGCEDVEEGGELREENKKLKKKLGQLEAKL